MQSTLTRIRNSPQPLQEFLLLNVNDYMQIFVICTQAVCALRNIHLWIISGECPLSSGGLRHTTVSASVHTQAHSQTVALKKPTQGRSQSSVYSQHRLEHTAMCEHRYVNEADTV